MKTLVKLVLVVCSVLIALPLTGSHPVSAGVINLPRQAEGLVDEQDILTMARHMAYARSAELLGYLDALDEVMTPLIETVRAELGNEMPPVTDISSLKSAYIAKLESIGRAGSIANAENIISTLQSEAEETGRTLRNLESEMRALEPLLMAKAGVIEAEIRAQIETEVQTKAAELEAELNSIGEQKGAAEEASVRARAEAYAKSTEGQNVDMDEVNARVDGWIAESKAKITAEMNSLVAQKEQEIRDWAERRAQELQNEQFQKFMQIQDGFADINSRIESRAAQKKAQYETHFDEFLAMKKNIVRKAMLPQYEAAVAMIKKHEAELNLAVSEGREGVPSMAQLLQEFDTNWEILMDIVLNAEHPEAIDEAIEGFKGYWKVKQSQLELAKSQGAEELVRITLNKLEENNAVAKLTEAKQEMTTLIAELESKSNLPDEARLKFRLMKEILPHIDDALEIIDRFKNAKADEDIAELMKLKDELQERLAIIVSLSEQLGKFEIPGMGIYIEAEHESFTKLLPYTQSWHSKKTTGHPPHRPPLSNGGLWYLSRAPETLGYYFTVETAGDYTIWLRDLASTDRPVGERRVNIFVNGRDYGSFNEHSVRTPYPKGTMEWHPTATVTLAPGKHTLEIKKMANTRGAALIDAIYITKNAGDDPRQMGLR